MASEYLPLLRALLDSWYISASDSDSGRLSFFDAQPAIISAINSKGSKRIRLVFSIIMALIGFRALAYNGNHELLADK